MNFDKVAFAEFLKAAKGGRSINKYGLDSGVDPGYISRLLRGLIDTAPSAEIINKLTKKAHNGIGKEQLMIAAGYLDSKDIDMVREKTEPYTVEDLWVFFDDLFANKTPEEQKKLQKEMIQKIIDR